MKKIIVLLAIVVSLGACNIEDERNVRYTPGVYTGSIESRVFEVCLNGVAYYRMHYMMAPAFKADGSLYLC